MEKKRPDMILRTLREAGFEAWYVGGCVRDTLLGRPIHDWDITTSALPEQVMACFSHCVPTGLRHGTVTVLTDAGPVEVTTYRTDGDYPDGRHPRSVTFVRSLREDLARRDFTVNAMAMDENENIVDLYGGRADLNAGLLRCVGKPEQRFREDALRMLRAIRFSAQLGFEIESETRQAINELGNLCGGLSAERIRDEVEKTVLSSHPEKIREMEKLELPESFGLRNGKDCSWLSALTAERTVRWAALCRSYPHLDLTALRLDRQTVKDAETAGRMAFPTDRLGWKKCMAACGTRQAMIAAELAGCADMVREIVASGECTSLKDLAVGGRDFPQLQGKALGAHLQALLEHVLEYPLDNRREVLEKISIKI